MTRALLIASAVLIALPSAAWAKRRPFTPVEKFALSDAILVGKVTAVEKDRVTALAHPGATEKFAYTVAVLKVGTGIHGVDGQTHVKVGFRAAPADPNAEVPPRTSGPQPVELAEGQEGLFYLSKHHSGDFYTVEPMFAPLPPADPGYKEQVELAKTMGAVLADPVKALKADKDADRTFAAVLLVLKYRSYPLNGREVEPAKVPADESALLLKALAGADWKKAGPHAPSAYQAFGMLALTDKDGWKFPQPKPGADFIDTIKDAFATWLAGPGKDYQVNKLVPKKAK